MSEHENCLRGLADMAESAPKATHDATQPQSAASRPAGPPAPGKRRRSPAAEQLRPTLDARVAHQRYFTQGRDAENALRAIVPAPGLHAVVKVGRATGGPTRKARRHQLRTLNLAFWETPYSSSGEVSAPSSTISCSIGEEFLAPSMGPSLSFLLERRAPPAPAAAGRAGRVGSIIAIDPQTPPHVGRGRAAGRSVDDHARPAIAPCRSAPTDVTARADRTASAVVRRWDSSDPSHYALIAWGCSNGFARIASGRG